MLFKSIAFGRKPFRSIVFRWLCTYFTKSRFKWALLSAFLERGQCRKMRFIMSLAGSTSRHTRLTQNQQIGFKSFNKTWTYICWWCCCCCFLIKRMDTGQHWIWDCFNFLCFNQIVWNWGCHWLLYAILPSANGCY